MNKPAPTPLRMESLSNRKKKQFKERIRELREKFHNREYASARERKDCKMVNPFQQPTAEVYEWLDGLADEPLREGEYVVQFSDEV